MKRRRKSPPKQAGSKIAQVMESGKSVLAWAERNRSAITDQSLLNDIRQLQEAHSRIVTLSKRDKLDYVTKRRLYGFRRMQKAIIADIAARREELDLPE